ncbi:hypothetical protein FOA52_003833 [Chlamydomonas sp. UWO 241]|nr:hypothetical protein FOA52_003833 [Chlamydomonas sp. UWO 241]
MCATHPQLSRLDAKVAIFIMHASVSARRLLTELSKDNFWEYLRADEQRGMTIVVDCYTDWCGPCKMIMPDLIAYSAELEPKGRIVKFNCNKANKTLGVELKIKVAPTFLVYRDGEQVGHMTGAKVQKLRNLVASLQEVEAPAEAL